MAKLIILLIQKFMKTSNIRILLNELVSVDFNDKFIGSIPKWDAHLNSYILKNEAFPHRAFSIFLFNSQNKLLLQRRSADKKTFPLSWTNTCCSHPNMIQNLTSKQKEIENIRDSLHRALDRQLKMNLQKQKFYLVDKILYRAQGRENEQFGQYQVDYVYLCKIANQQVPFTQVPEQVCQTKWVSKNQLDQFVENKQKIQKCQFTPWFMKMYKSGLLNKWWDMAVQNQLKNANTQQKLPVTSL